jgi:hypothetical protein
MRALLALALVAVITVGCGGGASSPPIKVAPAVTSPPTSAPAASGASAAPAAPATAAPTGGYDYGY